MLSLLTETLNAASLLNLNGSWQHWFPGVLVLAGGAFFVRGPHRRWPAAASAKEANRDLVQCEDERSRTNRFGAALPGPKESRMPQTALRVVRAAMMNLESVPACEGTEQIHSLSAGAALTGTKAFS